MYSVIQVVDSLQVGGLESVAVNFANLLPDRGVSSFLCSTRAGGPLERRISDRVRHVSLGRKKRIDLAALRKFLRFIRQHHVDIIHAHGTSLFISAFATMFAPRTKVIWHVHFGRYATEPRFTWLYRLATKRVAKVIAVSEPLADWARSKLKVPKDRVWYVPNFVVEPSTSSEETDLPGVAGKRIVCVANLRPEKDHLTLIEAMRNVVQVEPKASLFLVGSEFNREQVERVLTRIQLYSLDEHVFLLGSKSNVWPILRSCDVGVLPSASEGMPLALLEYGMAGLPTVATRVGQVSEVLDNGRAGILVPPGRPVELAAALLKLIQSSELRGMLGKQLKRHVQEKYSEAAVMDKVVRIYGDVMKPNANRTTNGGMR